MFARAPAELGINADTPSGASGQPLLLNPIVVKDKVGKVLPISVTPTSAVEDVKAAIERASGVPVYSYGKYGYGTDRKGQRRCR